jgi:8-amino-7-oxononanoate synthase
MRFKGPTRVAVGSADLVFFGGANYLSLSHHPRVLGALKNALDRYGFGIGASRNTTGATEELLALERRTARVFHAEDAIVVSAGYLANLAVLEGLVGMVDTWLADECSHPSFLRWTAGAQGKIILFKHCDLDRFLAQLKTVAPTERVAVFTDAVFPLTGDAPPLRGMLNGLSDRAYVLVLDEAHSLGTLGATGHGLLECLSIVPNHVVVTGTFSKAFGCVGGLIFGPRDITQGIRQRSATLAASSVLPPTLCAGARAALEAFEAEPQRLATLKHHTDRVSQVLRAASCPIPPHGVPIFYLDSTTGLDLTQVHTFCLTRGLYLPYIYHYPNVPEGGILRWIVQADHTAADIDLLCATLHAAIHQR